MQTTSNRSINDIRAQANSILEGIKRIIPRIKTEIEDEYEHGYEEAKTASNQGVRSIREYDHRQEEADTVSNEGGELRSREEEASTISYRGLVPRAIREYVGENRGITSENLAELTSFIREIDNQEDYYMFITFFAIHPNTPGESLARIANLAISDYDFLLNHVAIHPNTPGESLAALTSFAISRLNESLADNLLLYIVSNPNTHGESLAGIASSAINKSLDIPLNNLIINPNTPETTLRSIAEFAIGRPDFAYLLTNLALMYTTPQDVLEAIVKHATIGGNRRLLQGVARNPSISDELGKCIVGIAINKGFWWIIRSLAKKDNINTAILDAIADYAIQGNNHSLIKHLLDNKSITIDTLEKLERYANNSMNADLIEAMHNAKSIRSKEIKTPNNKNTPSPLTLSKEAFDKSKREYAQYVELANQKTDPDAIKRIYENLINNPLRYYKSTLVAKIVKSTPDPQLIAKIYGDLIEFNGRLKSLDYANKPMLVKIIAERANPQLIATIYGHLIKYDGPLEFLDYANKSMLVKIIAERANPQLIATIYGHLINYDGPLKFLDLNKSMLLNAIAERANPQLIATIYQSYINGHLAFLNILDSEKYKLFITILEKTADSGTIRRIYKDVKEIEKSRRFLGVKVVNVMFMTVIESIAKNMKTPSDILREIFEHVVNNGDQYNYDSKRVIIWAIGSNPSTPENVVQAILNSKYLTPEMKQSMLSPRERNILESPQLPGGFRAMLEEERKEETKTSSFQSR
jgi:hypothetical protein